MCKMILRIRNLYSGSGLGKPTLFNNNVLILFNQTFKRIPNFQTWLTRPLILLSATGLRSLEENWRTAKTSNRAYQVQVIRTNLKEVRVNFPLRLNFLLCRKAVISENNFQTVLSLTSSVLN